MSGEAYAAAVTARLPLHRGIRLARPLPERTRVGLRPVVPQHAQHEGAEGSPRTALAVASHLLVPGDATRLQQLLELGGWPQGPAFGVEQLRPVQVNSPG